jgi:hypothetical protein
MEDEPPEVVFCNACSLPVFKCDTISLPTCGHMFDRACLYYHVKKHMLAQNVPKCPAPECGRMLTDVALLGDILSLGIHTKLQVDVFCNDTLKLHFQDPRISRVQLFFKIKDRLMFLALLKPFIH